MPRRPLASALRRRAMRCRGSAQREGPQIRLPIWVLSPSAPANWTPPSCRSAPTIFAIATGQRSRDQEIIRSAIADPRPSTLSFLVGHGSARGGHRLRQRAVATTMGACASEQMDPALLPRPFPPSRRESTEVLSDGNDVGSPSSIVCAPAHHRARGRAGSDARSTQAMSPRPEVAARPCRHGPESYRPSAGASRKTGTTPVRRLYE